MPDERLTLVDLCKGFRTRRARPLQAPLDTVVPVGLAPIGCQPAIAHHQASNGAILSRFDQANGSYRAPLLTIDAEDSSHPAVTPAVAGLPRSVMSGSATLPYPASAITYEVLFYIDGLPQFRDLSGLPPTDVGNLVNADGRNQSIVGTSMWRDLLLGGPSRFDGRSTFLPYHSYEYGVQYVVCPNGEPSILRYDANISEYAWPQSSAGAGRSTTRQVNPLQPFTLPQYVIRLLIWEANPAFDAFMAGETLEPGLTVADALAVNGPSLARKYVFHPFQTVAMPAYGGTYTQSHDFSGQRANLILWTTSDVNSVTINGNAGGAYSGSAPAARIPGTFGQSHNLYAYPNAIQYAIDPFETTFSVSITAFSEVFDLTASPFSFSAFTDIPRWYEGLVQAFIEV